MTGPRRLALVAAIGLSVALAAAIAAIASFGMRVRSREIAGDVRRGGAVLALEPSAARRVVVAAGGATAELVRDGARWRPARDDGPGHGAAVPALLDQLSALRRRTTSASARGREELDAYGLDRPRVRLVVTLSDGTELRVAIGNTTGSDGITFVSAPDGTVAMVAADVGEALAAAASDVLVGGRGPSVPARQVAKPEG
jgi:hypothetical protein